MAGSFSEEGRCLQYADGFRSTRFSIKKMSELDVFSARPGETIFGAISDVLGAELVSKDGSVSSFAYCMYPTPMEYKERMGRQIFSPLIAICFSDAEKIVRSIRSVVPAKLINRSIAKLSSEDRRILIDGIGHAFDEAFVGGISVPLDILAVKESSKLKVTYGATLSMLLIPLLRMHSDAGIKKISLNLPCFGGRDYDAIKRSKELLKAMGFAKTHSVNLFGSEDSELWMCCRFIYWAVHRAHNAGDSQDLMALEDKLSSKR